MHSTIIGLLAVAAWLMTSFFAEAWFPLGDWRWAAGAVFALLVALAVHRHKRWRDARILTPRNVDATGTLTGGLVGSIGGTASLGPPNPWRYPIKWFRWRIARTFVPTKQPTPRAGRGEYGTVSVAGIEGQGRAIPDRTPWAPPLLWAVLEILVLSIFAVLVLGVFPFFVSSSAPQWAPAAKILYRLMGALLLVTGILPILSGGSQRLTFREMGHCAFRLVLGTSMLAIPEFEGI